jgi:cation:H+ antiporter
VAREDVRRDLSFFIPVFLSVTLIGLVSTDGVTRRLIAAALLIAYAAYGVALLRIERGSEGGVEHGLYLERLIAGAPERPRVGLILLQVGAALIAILLGARRFVDQIVNLSTQAGLSPGLLSLILSPLATELPEKYNSVVWIRQRKDHLAMANITGAMVFQSCIPVALGLIFTRWRLTQVELLASAVALGSSGLLFINLRDAEVGTPTLVLGGAAYVVFLVGLRMLGAF